MLTDGSLKKRWRQLSLPLFVDIALVMMLGTVDTFMLGRYSDAAVAAVGVDNQLMSLIFLVYQFFSMGSAILCSQYLGAGENKRMVQVVGLSLMMNFVVGISVSTLIFFNAEGILHLMGLRETLMSEGLTYLKITGLFSFAQAISLALSASLRSAGKTNYPMIVTIVSNVLNIIGNYILIFGKFGMPAMGVKGAAISTALSRGIAMCLLLFFHTRFHIKKFPLKWFLPFPVDELKKLVKVGIPAMSEELSYCSSQLVGMYMINRLGDVQLATRAYCWNILQYCCLFSASFTQGGAIIIGNLIGQAKERAAYIFGNHMLKVELKVCVSVAAFMALCSRFVLAFFTSNPEILHLGVYVFCINVFLEIGRTRNIYACGALRATGDVIYPVVIGITFQWLIAVGVACLFGLVFGFGLLGIWFAWALDENTRGVILTRRWRSLRWMGRSFV